VLHKGTILSLKISKTYTNIMPSSLRHLLLSVALLFVASGIQGCGEETQNSAASSYDIVIYGATSSGIAAAIQCSRMDKSVLLIEPTRRIGGLTTWGLGATDIGNKIAIGGISREFYQNIHTHYEDTSNWDGQTREDYIGSEQNRTSEEE